MIKSLLLFLLLLPLYAFGQTSLSFELTFGNQRGQATVDEWGNVHVTSSDFSPEFARSIENSLRGTQAHKESVQTAQQGIYQRLNSSLGVTPRVRFDARASSNNPFIRRQTQEDGQFEEDLYKDIYHPKFKSPLLKKEIQFDASDKDDRDALKVYRAAQKARASQLGTNEEYHEATFAKNAIEIRQNSTRSLSQDELRALTQVSDGVLNNDSSLVVNAMKLLLNSREFQTGFSVALLDSLNPASFVYPLDPRCSTDWCTAGQYLGNATGLLIGAYEFMSGVTTTIGGAGLTLAAAGSGGGVVALPATAGATLAGIAMAGHGLGVIGQAFNNLFEPAQTAENVATTEETLRLTDEAGLDRALKQDLLEHADPEALDEITKTLKDTEISKYEKQLIVRSFETKTIKVKVLDEDLVVYRWHNNDSEVKRIGRYVSPENLPDASVAREQLALSSRNQMTHYESYTLKKGTRVLEGFVAPNFDRPGGGRQYFIIGDVFDLLIPKVLP